ncbi:MAG TPA: BCCT family transporter, partial [Kiritimatiellia bacterium]|nr:BCCT family transporter [Kiritimatiellia bacterium]
VVAAVLLIGGGLETLQVASVCAGLPFALILLVMIYSLYLGFRQEDYVEEAVRARLEDVEAEHELAETIAAIVEEKTGGT